MRSWWGEIGEEALARSSGGYYWAGNAVSIWMNRMGSRHLHLRTQRSAAGDGNQSGGHPCCRDPSVTARLTKRHAMASLPLVPPLSSRGNQFTNSIADDSLVPLGIEMTARHDSLTEDPDGA